MAEAPASGPERLDDPERLWIWERHVYLDEHKRSWLPIILETDEKLQVLLRQQDVSLGSPMTPEQLTAYELPLLWQLYPGKRYRGSDSKFWLILYHVKLRGVEDMLLELLESEEYDTVSTHRGSIRKERPSP